MNIKNHISRAAKQFRIDGRFLEARTHGSGHINDTYVVYFQQGGAKVPYILQRINHQVFHHPELMMENIVRVTQHMRQKLEMRNEKDISRHVLTVILTHDGLGYYRDPEGNYWRAYNYIGNAGTYDLLHSTDQVFEVARMFGQFLEMLHDFPDPPLHETIPGFHNGPERLEAFQKALETDAFNRAKNAKPEIDFVLAHTGLFDVLPALVKKGKIPVRAVHNDTKVNNVLLDDTTGKGVCVIDLDTVMPGLSLYDFGDLARTTLSLADEDERDLSGVSVQMPRFQALLKGFLSAAGGILTQTERDYLVFSTKMMTQIIGIRFLTDYLSGDIYFKTHRRGHNLDRCRTQFKLVRSIMEHEDEMNAMVNS